MYSTKAESTRCPRCSVRIKDGVKEYYERVATVSYVGEGPALVIGMRRRERGEGELPAAIALLKDLYFRNTRFCDVVVADALYAAASFINVVKLGLASVLVYGTKPRSIPQAESLSSRYQKISEGC